MLDRRSVYLVIVALAFAFAMPLATAHADTARPGERQVSSAH
jgi:hypothetical protein